MGGFGRLKVSAEVPGAVDNPVVSDPRWITIPGANPDLAVAKAFVDQNEPVYADTVRHLFCWESKNHAWLQFDPASNAAEPASGNVPPDFAPNPGPLRPAFGPPAGIGIAQLDPAQFPAQQWNWKENELGGIQTFHQKLAIAQAWRGREQQRLDSKRNAVLARANQNRAAQGLPPTNGGRIVVPALTVQQLGRDAIRAYNGGHQYYFDAHYVLGANGISVAILGTRQWVESPGLRWSPQAGPNSNTDPIGYLAWLTAPAAWVPVPPLNMPYVDQVMGCANH